MDWYKVADAKGRLLLTLNGIYITVLAKHRWVNKGWAAAGTSLLLLLTATVTAVAT